MNSRRKHVLSPLFVVVGYYGNVGGPVDRLLHYQRLLLIINLSTVKEKRENRIPRD